MNWIYGIGIVVILALAALGVYLGWKYYHEKGKEIVEDVKDDVDDIVDKI